MSILLLTGASGLVGSRLLPRLVQDGFDCRALLRSERTLPAGAVGVRGDLDDPSLLREAVEGVDSVVHLAAFFRTADDDAIWRANLDGTRNLVEAVKAYAPQARFVMASTGNVYDAGAQRPGRETDSCTPTAAYPASKLAAEALLRESGLTWSIVRLPFVYGDGDGHLASMPTLASRFGLHPAHTYSVMHQRSFGRPRGECDRRRPRHGLRDGRTRRESHRGLGGTPGEPVVRPDGLKPAARAGLPAFSAHHPAGGR